ncbi:MAG: hypothetical protein LBU38_04725, partial [Propionibacteriaceae bacterium]|nr:hypothetical protein [Propionibacteriaceae bacterium]
MNSVRISDFKAHSKRWLAAGVALAISVSLAPAVGPFDVPEAQAAPPGATTATNWFTRNSAFAGGADGMTWWDPTCQSLYTVSDTGNIRRFNDPTGSTAVSSPVGSQGSGRDTIALYRRPDNSMSMYAWNFGGGNPTVTEINNGSRNGQSFTVVTSGGGGSNGRSGGEFNQLTGELIMTGYEQSSFSGNWRITVVNVDTGVTRQSGRIQPATSSDGSNIDSAYISSDAAIDANGLIYVIAGAASNRWLVRIVPGATQGSWRYNKVVRLTNPPGGADLWGMAFFNGMLYVRQSVTAMWKVDPLSGASERVPGTATGSFDYAGCQVAGVIQGTVYNDVNGDGDVAGDSGQSGVRVEIYDSAKRLRGSQETSDEGSYSFLIPDTHAKYFVRVVRPEVGGVHASQTYANYSEAVS